MIERLEDRTVLSTVFVVPIGQALDATHRHSLADAIPFAGPSGTVIIEAGATADAGTVTITLASITIQGDPAFAPGSLPLYDLNINANGVTLTNLNLDDVTVAATANDVTVTHSNIKNFTETGAVTGVGSNTLSHNLITGAVDLQGNSGIFQPTADLVEFNEFVGFAPVLLKLTNSNNTIIQNNHFTGDASGGVGIQVRSNSEAVMIKDNIVEMLGAGQPLGIYLLNTGGAAGNILGAQVLDNTISTAGLGTGLYCNIFGTGAFMVAKVEGNTLVNNKVGIDINGIPGVTGAGNIDLGGGSNVFGTSKGANSFRGFDGVNGHFAIYLHNTDAGITVSAMQNIFNNGIDPNTVVRDQDNGGGSGILNVANALDPDHAFVQSLYIQLLGRAGDTTQGGEIDQWVSKLSTKHQRGVAKGILFSGESLARIVDGLFVDDLGRNATDAEIAKFSKQLKAGKNLSKVEAGILGSVEYQTRIDTNYVQALYLEVLNRPATSAEVISGFKSLPVLGLKGLAAKITNLKEARTDFVEDLYRDLLHRDATADESAALVKRSANLLTLELTLLSSTDYYSQG